MRSVWGLATVVHAVEDLILMHKGFGLGLAVLLLTLVWPAPKPSTAQDPPNIVFILTDDMRADQLAWMPTLQSELVAKGKAFSRYYVNNPLCCPSRATILTGTYNHTNGVYQNSNSAPNGGWNAFKPNEPNTIAVALQAAGYRTGLVGKYMNGYDQPSYVPVGWDRWVANVNRETYSSQELSVDGVDTFSSGYSTDVLASYARTFIDHASTTQPLFLYFAVQAPHSPATPPTRYKSTLNNVPFPSYPNFNEADVSDKPSYVQRQPPLTSTQQMVVVNLWHKELNSLLAVDDAISGILDALASTGRLSNTLIMFSSDNGLELGEHRFLDAKSLPYEESVHVPLIARWDGQIAPATTDSSHILGAVDLATTWANLGLASLPNAEGLDTTPLLLDTPTTWRQYLLIEHARSTFPAFCQIEASRETYVSYRGGEEELYDLQTDPYELQNRASDPLYATILATLRQQKTLLCQPPPPGY
jgi:N-acetylglucosamine-6-sulfatase